MAAGALRAADRHRPGGQRAEHAQRVRREHRRHLGALCFTSNSASAVAARSHSSVTAGVPATSRPIRVDALELHAADPRGQAVLGAGRHGADPHGLGAGSRA